MCTHLFPFTSSSLDNTTSHLQSHYSLSSPPLLAVSQGQHLLTRTQARADKGQVNQQLLTSL